MHDIVYSITCSRMSNGLSLGSWYMHFASLYLHHIGLVYIVICIIHYSCISKWFMGLSYKVSPLIFNFWETENLLFSYFVVLGTFWTTISSGIFIVSIFCHEKQLDRWKHTGGAMRPKQAWVARPTDLATPAEPVCSSSVVSPPSSYVCLCFDRKGTPYFPIIIWGGGGGGTLLSPPEGLICYCHRREITAIITINSSLA
jgi:hypothetical protein